jgi:hypothetical protein
MTHIKVHLLYLFFILFTLKTAGKTNNLWTVLTKPLLCAVNHDQWKLFSWSQISNCMAQDPCSAAAIIQSLKYFPANRQASESLSLQNTINEFRPESVQCQAVSFSEISVNIYQTTRCYIPDDRHLQFSHIHTFWLVFSKNHVRCNFIISRRNCKNLLLLKTWIIPKVFRVSVSNATSCCFTYWP